MLRVFVFFLVWAVSPAYGDAGEARTRGASIAQSALGAWGSDEALNSNAMQPLATSGELATTDGTTFNVNMDCPASERFMRVRVFPGSNGDIEAVGVELDTNEDGSYDSNIGFTGPYAGVCYNGLISCNPGTYSNCVAFQWHSNDGNVELNPVDKRDVGSCYCINESCGDNLLAINSRKVVGDIGTGIAMALKRDNPRLNIGEAEHPDPYSVEYYAKHSECSTDRQAEQYYTNMDRMEAEGAAEQNNPNSDFYFLKDSEVAEQHKLTSQNCQINRKFNLRVVDAADVVVLRERQPRGYVQSCGENCWDYALGQSGNNYYDDGTGHLSCRKFDEHQIFEVKYPESVTEARIWRAEWDDALRIALNGNAVFSRTPRNYNSCEYSTEFRENLDINVLDAFRNPNNGEVHHTHELWVGGKGEALSILRIKTVDACDLESEELLDACQTYASDEKCELRDEWIDDVQTVRNFSPTGLQPQPSTREIKEGDCSIGEVTRDYWQIRRVYACEYEDSDYDFEDSRERRDHIGETFDPETGDFEDKRKGDDESWQTSSESFGMPPPSADAGCTQTCKVRKPKPGVDVSEQGATNEYNKDGIAYDYTYRSCDDSTSCPLEEGEELVEACNCRSSFAEAAAFMQLIRMTSQDQVCTKP